MDHELMTSTRGAHIFAVEVNQKQAVAIVGTTNHNFMCFDLQEGVLIPTRSCLIHNQSIVPNRALFLKSFFGQQQIQLNEVYQVKLLEKDKVLIFDGRTLHFVTLKIDSPIQERKSFDL
jgi:hypothetical protein